MTYLNMERRAAKSRRLAEKERTWAVKYDMFKYYDVHTGNYVIAVEDTPALKRLKQRGFTVEFQNEFGETVRKNNAAFAVAYKEETI